MKKASICEGITEVKSHVIPACREFFDKNDCRQAGMTKPGQFCFTYKFITIFCLFALMLAAFTAQAQGEFETTLEKQKLELAKKEEIIRQESERLKTLKKEVEDDIAKYTALLQQIEKSLQQVEETANKRLRHVAKAYEAMSPEDAAPRLEGLDNETAVQILLKMDSKKAGLVIGMMDAKKATHLTKEIAKLKL